MIKNDILDFGWMKYVYNYIDISCTDKQLSEIRPFAEAVYDKRKTVYKKRGQADRDTIVDQIETSKAYEFMVYNYVKDTIPKDLTVKPPSLEIYGRYTTFDNDLDIVGDDEKSVGVHVKSQDICRIDATFPISWGFQKIDPIFSQKKDDILIMGIYKDKNNGMILAKDNVSKFKEYLKPAMLSKLHDKLFLYYDVNKPAFNLEDK